ncbi:MAG TPA: type 4 pilus major pilin [Alphaproteobacteria bacterium]|nr:type 4 pilus major pilin [Alphaproteobacteria bacterium]
MKRNLTSQSGFSLLEMAIVLTVIGVVLGGIWVLAVYAWERTRQERVAEEITSTVRNTRAYYAGQASVSGSFTTLAATLGAANVFPGDMLRINSCTNGSNLCYDHPWSGAAGNVATGSFSVCPWSPGAGVFACSAGPTPYFAVELRSVPSASCMNLVARNSGSNAPSGLIDVIINGTTSMAATGHAFPVRASDSSASCTAAAAVTVDFVYGVANPTN